MFGKMFEWVNLNRVFGILGISNGGTGATNASDARDNLGLGDGDSPQFTGLNLSSLTPYELVATDATKNLASFPSNSLPTQLFLSSENGGLPSWQPIPVQGNLVYYFTNTASDIVGDYKQTIDPFPTLQTISNAGVVDGQLLATWATEPNNPSLTSIPAGQYSCHIHAAKTSGTKTSQVRAEVWEVNAAGTDIAKIADLGPSTNMTGSNAEYFIADSILEYTLASNTSRIITKIYAVITGGGSDPTLAIYLGDGSDTRLNLPSSAITASFFVPYTGAVKNLDLGTNTITASNFSGSSSGTNTGDQTITLTGDITGSGTGSFATTIGALKVTNAMLVGSIANAKLANSSITIGSTSIALGATSLTLAGLTSIGTSTLTASGLITANASLTLGGTAQTLNLSSGTSNTIIFNGAGTGNPTSTIRSGGTKIVLYPNVGVSSVDYAMGIAIDTFWNSIPAASAAYSFKWFAAETQIGSLNGTGNLVLTGTTPSSSSITGSIRTVGGIGISGTTNASSATIGGTFTTSGGAAVAKDFYVGGNVSFTRLVAATSGSNRYFTITPVADTGLTASTEVPVMSIGASTRQWATGALTNQRNTLLSAPTYSFVGASTITNAATLAISGAPIQGTNASFSFSTGLLISDSSTAMTSGSVYGAIINAQTSLSGSTSWSLACPTTGVNGRGVTIGSFSGSATLYVTRSSAGNGTVNAVPYFHVVGVNDLANGASTEFSFTRMQSSTRQWATGALTIQRENRYDQPTYTFVGASTIADAANIAILGAPAAGTNAIITRTHALLIQTSAVGASSVNSYGLTVNAQTGATNNFAAQFLGGNVGIGLSNPTRTLDVSGTLGISGASTLAAVSSNSLTMLAVVDTLVLKQGANGKTGTVVANGVTDVTVNNTSITANSNIIFTLKTAGGTVGAYASIKTITAGTGFTVSWSALDTSTYNYAIIESAT
jgi:hypothetical protein